MPSFLRLAGRHSIKHFRTFLIVIVIFTLGNSSDSFIVLLVQNRGLTVLQIMGMLMTFNAVYALLAGPMGSLSDRIGRRKLMLVGWTTYGLVYLGFALSHTGIQVGFYTAYMGSITPLLRAWQKPLWQISFPNRNSAGQHMDYLMQPLACSIARLANRRYLIPGDWSFRSVCVWVLLWPYSPDFSWLPGSNDPLMQFGRVYACQNCSDLVKRTPPCRVLRCSEPAFAGWGPAIRIRLGSSLSRHHHEIWTPVNQLLAQNAGATTRSQ